MELEKYYTLFHLFLVITIILIIISVVLFFVLDVRKIISVKTGFAKKKRMQQLNKINERKAETKNIKKDYYITEVKDVRASNVVIQKAETEYLLK